MRTVVHPSGQKFVVGSRLRPPSPPRLRMARYVRLDELPDPPISMNYGPKGAPALGLMYGNDRVGDCVLAALYHMAGVWTGNAGGIYVATDDVVVGAYSAVTGYDPSAAPGPDGSNPTDRGTDEVSALEYVRTSGFADGTQVLGWAAVDATDVRLVKQSLFVFETLLAGAELPKEWLAPFPSAPGFTWPVAGDPVPENGHAFCFYDYDDAGAYFCTWGLVSPDGLRGGFMPWDAVAKYLSPTSGGELYAVLSPDQVARGQSKAPNGVDWLGLLEDLAAEGGNVTGDGPSAPTEPAPPGSAP